MVEIKSSSYRSIIMEMLKEKFSSYIIWEKIEVDLAIMCSDLPEVDNEEKKIKMIMQLKRIKNFMLEHEAPKEDLEFLDEEIQRYQYTKEISLYHEQDTYIDNHLVNRYAQMSYGTEGVVGIHLDLNYEQLKRLTNGVYDQTGLIKFYISKEKTIAGQIVAEVFETPQDIPVASLIESKDVHKETGAPVEKKISLFGEKVNNHKYYKIKEVYAPFRVYRFITEFKQDLILFTNENLSVGDYIATGVVTKVDDYKSVTDSARLPTKLPYFFVHSIRNRIPKYKNHEEFLKRLAVLKINKTNIFNYPFIAEIENPEDKSKKKNVIIKHPKWFKWLIWSWLTHANKGMFNKYPMHIMMLGPAQSGKSFLMNTLHKRSKENQQIFSGTMSTLKKAVPSFKYRPADPGYLAKSNRFAFLDEFLRCLIRNKSNKEGGREESVGIMNDLLEHQKRECGSGVSALIVNMTARTIAASNPVRGVMSVTDLVNAYDLSFLSRWIIYWQTDEHFEMIRNAISSDLKEAKFIISNNEWISILDYLQSFSADYDDRIVKKIFESSKGLLSETLLSHYQARHIHHLECLIDGIVKTRCLFERNITFKAKEEDYEMLKLIWSKIIGSWIDFSMLKNIPIHARINYLPENCQFVLSKLVEFKEEIKTLELQEECLKYMSKNDFLTAYIILREQDIIVEDVANVKPYWFDKNDV